MATGKLSRQEMWVAAHSTIWRTLSYPLPALNLTRQQWDDLLALLIRFLLPKLGVCRNFPRGLVFAPEKFFGLGLTHLFTMQEIARVKDIIYHTANETTTGDLYTASIELLYIELGSFLQLKATPFATWGHLTTTSLVKSTWEFLDTYSLSLYTPIDVTLPRQGDNFLMPLLADAIHDPDHLKMVNGCRLFLKVMFLSEITDGSGTTVLDEAWLGTVPLGLYRSESWPNVPRPLQLAWDLWRSYLKQAILRRGCRLKNPLGAWLAFDTTWPWYYCQNSGCLHLVTNNQWKCFPPLITRWVRPVFSSTSIGQTQPITPCRATVYKKREVWVMSGFGPISTASSAPSDFLSYLHKLLPNMAWCTENLRIIGEWSSIAEAIKKGVAHIVSDGSFVDSFSTAAFILEGNFTQVKNQVITLGRPQDMSAYQSEISGLYAAIFLIHSLCNFFQIEEGSVTIGCDGLSALHQAFSSFTPPSTDCPSFDLIMAIHQLCKCSQIQWQPQYVAGHQVDHAPFEQLDRLGQLNVEADNLAKAHTCNAKLRPRHYAMFGEPWSLYYRGCKLQKLSKEIIHIIHSQEAIAYWTAKEKVQPLLLQFINWEAIDKAMKSQNRARRIFLAKHTMGMCGVGQWMK